MNRIRTSSHSDEVRQVYERVLAGASVRSRFVNGGEWTNRGSRVHVLEKGAGAPVVLLPGAAGTAGFFLPLLNELQGVRVLAPRPARAGVSPVARSTRR